MPRRNISLPADIDDAARAAGLNVSAIARLAIVAELDRRERMAQLDAYLDELDEKHGPPSDRAMSAARRWIDNTTTVDDAPSRATSTSGPRRGLPGPSATGRRAVS